jgi:hypothetical protein
MEIKSQNIKKENKYPTFKEYNLSLINKKTLITSLKVSISLVLTPFMIMSCGNKAKINSKKVNKVKTVQNIEKSEEKLIEKRKIKEDKINMIGTVGRLGVVGNSGPLNYRYNEIDDEDIRLPDEN